MVGALCLVGLSRAPPEAVRHALATCTRIPRVKPAPAHGLCLARVYYDDDDDAPPELLAAARTAEARFERGEQADDDVYQEERARLPVGTPRSAAASR